MDAYDRQKAKPRGSISAADIVSLLNTDDQQELQNTVINKTETAFKLAIHSYIHERNDF